MEKLQIKEGQVFYPKNEIARHNHRRVIGIINGRVFYSVGGEKNFSCSLKAFRAWIGDSING